MESSISAYGVSDLAVGTVTKAGPLEVSIRETMAPLPQEDTLASGRACALLSA